MRYLASTLIIFLLILDLLALDDITTGNEPEFFGEYFILAISVLVFLALGIFFFKKKIKKSLKRQKNFKLK
ncbi:MAG TPA: hypothetical protein VIK81_00230 [Patescibacteria group bacterium]